MTKTGSEGESGGATDSVLLQEQNLLSANIEKTHNNIAKSSGTSRTVAARERFEKILTKHWTQFIENHVVLLGQLPGDDAYVRNNMYAATQATIKSAKDRLAKWDLQSGAELPPPTDTDLQMAFPMGLPKLAPITIPKFSGGWDAWQPFIGLYNSVIHDNPRLAPIQKLQYLMTYLEGEPLDRVKHYPLANESYAVAYDDIKRRYDNERMICEQYVINILDLAKIPPRCAKSLLKIVTVLNASIHGLTRYHKDSENWAPFVVTCVTRKLDDETRTKFEESLTDPRKMPTIAALLEFLDRWYHILLSEPPTAPAKGKSVSAVAQSSPAADNAPKLNKRNSRFAGSVCVLCPGSQHSIRKCNQFVKKSVVERQNIARSKNLCFNCLGGHTGPCSSQYNCQVCNRRHHHLLHIDGGPNTSRTATANPNTDTDQPGSSTTAVTSTSPSSRDVLLATALIKVRDFIGQFQTLRALVDPGSQDSFITAEAANALGLPLRPATKVVSGIAGAHGGQVSRLVEIEMRPHFPTRRQFTTQALLLPRIISELPSDAVLPSSLPELPRNIVLADPTFAEPGPIDLLLGAGVFAEIIKTGTQKFNANKLLLQNTELGWILTGQTLDPQPHTVSFLTVSELHNKVAAFWEMDEGVAPDDYNRLDEAFASTTTRDHTGRYTVRLPLKDVPGKLGASRHIAVARLLNLERSFKKNHLLAQEYHKFLSEYEQLGHMTRVPPFSGPEGNAYYLPHHAVLKESSTTTKVRVVFNASAKTTTGISLNCLLEPGHKQQQDLRHILIRWRKHQVAITADIEKMFRQINVAAEDRDLQRIVWRANPETEIGDYQLNTVTYGTASATYLAVRTLIQLARDDGEQYPLARDVLVRDFYMDDLLSGAESVDGALRIQEQITALLARGGLPIRKWTSNSPALLEEIPEQLREAGDWFFNPDATIRTLGVVWSPQRDEFRIRLDLQDFQRGHLTKRTLLSNIATLFDPLGLLLPVTFACKTWMQQLWTDGTEWDQVVPSAINDRWEALYGELHLVHRMTIPRWLQVREQSEVQIHGFCDASEKGYAAVLYMRVLDSNGRVHCNLITARSRVAPLKTPQTLPRLELAGAVLLADLVNETRQSLLFNCPDTYLWCDSKIALAWIAKPPASWKAFVAHRVSTIHGLTDPCQWRYVFTKENPADVASRGCSPAALLHHPLWWHGPPWLLDVPEHWPSYVEPEATELEKKPAKTTNLMSTTMEDDTLLMRYSSFSRLTRITAWICRFCCNASRQSPRRGGLHPEELHNARVRLLLRLQKQSFAEEILALQRGQPLPRRSPLMSLAPILDASGLLLVGGRLELADAPWEFRHPVLLPRHHHLTLAIIHELHQRALHGGAQLTLSLFRQQYWTSNGKSTVQAVIRRCGRCRRYATSGPTQQMGNLPSNRVTASSPFTHTGVDYCGPFHYRCSKGRGIKTTKGYIAVFVCLSTKALHLELVSDLTTDAFLAALKRFIARRGLPLEMHSDNGTNFQGASKQITQQFQELLGSCTSFAADALATDGIVWHFIPVASPHFGGLWEAGVKSVKTHLKRTYGDGSLTYEEFTTLLHQIEACLNSRPLYPASSDPADLTALTPGHFLIGRPLLALPQASVQETNPVRRWALLTRMQQQFWGRWSAEYLHHLQQRSKWKEPQANPLVGDMVLLKDKGLPPCKWALGRIAALHPGPDGKVRMVTLRIRGKELQQPLVNLIKLSLWAPPSDVKTKE